MHFTVAVISKEFDGFEKLLAPFQENNMGDCPKEYLEFKSVEEEYLKEYLEEEIDIEGKKVSFKKRYPTFETFMEDWHGYSERDKEMGLYGDWYNPNTKWDWYQLGGRWKGLLLVKDRAREYAVGKPGVFGDNSDTRDVPGYKWVDIAKIKDIEWEKMAEIARKDAEKNWEEVHKKLESGEIDSMHMDFIYGISKEDTKESYVERSAKFGTYAVLTSDGKWHEKDDDKNFKKDYFDKFIKGADEELYLAVIDCHI